MSAISGSSSPLTSSTLTPQEQVDAALYPSSSNTASANETPAEQSDAAIVDLVGGSDASSFSSELQSGVPVDLAAASALVGNIAQQIGSQSSTAASVYSLLSASATLKLTA